METGEGKIRRPVIRDREIPGEGDAGGTDVLE
jgi:hypothetical protein